MMRESHPTLISFFPSPFGINSAQGSGFGAKVGQRGAKARKYIQAGGSTRIDGVGKAERTMKAIDLTCTFANHFWVLSTGIRQR